MLLDTKEWTGIEGVYSSNKYTFECYICCRSLRCGQCSPFVPWHLDGVVFPVHLFTTERNRLLCTHVLRLTSHYQIMLMENGNVSPIRQKQVDESDGGWPTIRSAGPTTQGSTIHVYGWILKPSLHFLLAPPRTLPAF